MNIFHHKNQFTPAPTPLQVPGVGEAPITPEPTDSELAAQALMDIIIEKRKASKHHHNSRKAKAGKTDANNNGNTNTADTPHDRKYYERLADRIGAAYDASRRRALRFVSFVEQELKKTDLPAWGEGSLALLETELYKRIDTVDREGGDLKKRWQNCLAEVTLRLMEADKKQKAENEKRYEEEYNEQHNQQA